MRFAFVIPLFTLRTKELLYKRKLFKLQFQKARFVTPVQIQRVYIKIPRIDSYFKNMRTSIFLGFRIYRSMYNSYYWYCSLQLTNVFDSF